MLFSSTRISGNGSGGGPGMPQNLSQVLTVGAGNSSIAIRGDNFLQPDAVDASILTASDGSSKILQTDDNENLYWNFYNTSDYVVANKLSALAEGGMSFDSVLPETIDANYFKVNPRDGQYSIGPTNSANFTALIIDDASKVYSTYGTYSTNGNTIPNAGNSGPNDVTIGGTYLGGPGVPVYEVTIDGINRQKSKLGSIAGSPPYFSPGDTVTDNTATLTGVVITFDGTNILIETDGVDDFSSATSIENTTAGPRLGSTAHANGFGGLSNTFTWTKNGIGGEQNEVMTGDDSLGDNMEVFADTTNDHPINDSWSMTVVAQGAQTSVYDTVQETYGFGDVQKVKRGQNFLFTRDLANEALGWRADISDNVNTYFTIRPGISYFFGNQGTNAGLYVGDGANPYTNILQSLVLGRFMFTTFGGSLDLTMGMQGEQEILWQGGTGAATVLLPTGIGDTPPLGTILTLTDYDAISGTNPITADAGTGNFIVSDVIAQTATLKSNGGKAVVKLISNVMGSLGWKFNVIPANYPQPVTDGTYTIGLGTPITGQDGTITVTNGIITAVQEVM